MWRINGAAFKTLLYILCFKIYNTLIITSINNYYRFEHNIKIITTKFHLCWSDWSTRNKLAENSWNPHSSSASSWDRACPTWHASAHTPGCLAVWLSWSRFPYFGKSGLVQISLFWQIWTSPDFLIFEIWTSPDLTFCESGPAGVENTISELIQIFLFWQIWSSPDFLILANLD